MKSFAAVLIALALASSLLGAASAQRYAVYNLPKGNPMDLPKSGKEFLEAFRARYGTTTPNFGKKSFAIETGMPGSFRNDVYGNCTKAGDVKLGYVDVHFYQSGDQVAGNAGKFVAFVMDNRSIEWLVTLVKADAKADAQSFDDDARRLVMAFAMRVGNYGTKGYVKEEVLDRALDLFIEAIKARGAANINNGNNVVGEFESKVDTVKVHAGHFWNKSNDTAEKLVEKFMALLPADLSR